ncbi:usg protein [Chthonobacter albigriseus]|uniref:usg protein n=1 Tax=Chthonobacter albigriseus TaxID=1683161 RepID=UPI0015EFB1EF|nr:usg protein [Chthonobacter albigriseus]
MVTPEFKLQLAGYGLTTAHILYRLPDHPKILQSYVWQDYDLAPEFPELSRFLQFWRTKLDGALHSVDVAHRKLIGPAEVRKVDAQFLLH